MKKIFVLAALLVGCGTHTIDFKATHFVTPLAGQETWQGHIAGVAPSAVTEVTLINDIKTNPPSRNTVNFNQDLDIGDILIFTHLGADAALTVSKGWDIVLDDSVFNLKYQFLNQEAQPHSWVASVQGGMGTYKKNTTDQTAEAKSNIKTTSAAFSVGYALEKAVPYISVLRQWHDVSTNVTNSNGSFGPFDDKGVHDSLAIGATSRERGFLWSIEYNFITMKWDRPAQGYHEVLGFRLGYAW